MTAQRRPMLALGRLLALATLALLSLGGFAQAETVAQSASDWGLIGTWRTDCAAPLSQGQPALSYVVRGGRLFHDRDFGGARDSNPVLLATPRSDGSIELLVDFPAFGQVRQFTVVKNGDGRIRTVSNRDVNTDQYSIRDGKFVANGMPPPPQSRCP